MYSFDQFFKWGMVSTKTSQFSKKYAIVYVIIIAYTYYMLINNYLYKNKYKFTYQREN